MTIHTCQNSLLLSVLTMTVTLTLVNIFGALIQCPFCKRSNNHTPIEHFAISLLKMVVPIAGATEAGPRGRVVGSFNEHLL